MHCNSGKPISRHSLARNLERRSAIRNVALILAVTATLGCGQTAVQTPAPTEQVRVPRRDNARQLFEWGRHAAQAGDSLRAEQYLASAIEAGFDETRALPILLGACLRGSRLRSALDHAEPYLLRHPEDNALRYLVATIHLSLGQTEAARLHLQELLHTVSNNADAHYLLGILETASSPPDANNHFRTYLTLAPSGGRAAEVRSRLIELKVRMDQDASPPNQAFRGAIGVPPIPLSGDFPFKRAESNAAYGNATNSNLHWTTAPP
jgi:tetratricopeptide (TPR) repeat protein